MKFNSIFIGTAVLAALGGAAAVQAQTTHPMGAMHNAASGPAGMQKMPMSGDTDKDFAMMMKLHHQRALDMAQVELDRGKSPEMKAMAQSIITSQKKEIAQFDAWLAKQK